MAPLIDGGVFEIEHDPGSAGVEHFDDQFGFIGGAGHLVALVLAPGRHADLPELALGLAGRQVGRQLAAVRGRQRSLAPGDKLLLPGSEALVQRLEELKETGGKFHGRVEASRRTVQVESPR